MLAAEQASGLFFGPPCGENVGWRAALGGGELWAVPADCPEPTTVVYFDCAVTKKSRRHLGAHRYGLNSKFLADHPNIRFSPDPHWPDDGVEKVAAFPYFLPHSRPPREPGPISPTNTQKGLLPDLPMFDGNVAPRPPDQTYDVKALEDLLLECPYPDPVVQQQVLSGLTRGFGHISPHDMHVEMDNHPSLGEEEQSTFARDELHALVKKGFAAGPFPRAPFPNPRVPRQAVVSPLGVATKGTK